MKRILLFILGIFMILLLSACGGVTSLTAEDVEKIVNDTGYYSDGNFTVATGKNNNFAPFSPVTPTFEGTLSRKTLPLTTRFPMLRKFKYDKSGITAYVNGMKNRTGVPVTVTVMLDTSDTVFTVCPTLVFIRKGTDDGTAVYNSIRLDLDGLCVPHLNDTDETAEFGDGYFAYTVVMESHSDEDLSNISPTELFSIDVTFPKPGFFTVAVIDSALNGGKYTDNLSLIME